VLSLYFQRVNGLSAWWTGLAFVPMMGAVLPVNLLAPHLAERIGPCPTIVVGALRSLARPNNVSKRTHLPFTIRGTGT
jgi:hypothetical protein